jgi:SAM-dependent methyltransferase
MSDQANDYDRYPFESQPGPERHIDRFAVLGCLFGVPTHSEKNFRVLEIGCSTGKNLIPQAEQFPGAEFFGVDISRSSIASAITSAQEVEVKNIQFQVADIREESSAISGEYDFIICHGVLSWVEAPVRDRIFEIFGNHLSEHGLVYVSYNLMPGWATRGEVRTRLLEEDRRSLKLSERIEAARRLMQQWEHDLQGDLNLTAIQQKDELQRCLTQSDAFILHELLAADSRPFFLREILDKAEQAGLQYVGEALPLRMYNPTFSEQEALPEGFSRYQKEQEVDHKSTLAFRGTLLCQKEVLLSDFARVDACDTLFVSSPLVPRADMPDIHSEQYIEFVSPDGRAVKENRPLVKAALIYLRGFWPEAVPFDELRQAAIGLAQSSDEVEDEDPLLLQKAICEFFFSGDADLHFRAPRCTRKVPLKPIVSRCARSEARQAWEITSLRHEYVELDQFQRQTIQFCDGEHSVAQIMESLFQCVKQGLLEPHEDGKPVTDESRLREIIAEGVEYSLKHFAEHALLVSEEGLCA